MKAAPTVEVMPNLPDQNSPEYKVQKKKHNKYINSALKSQRSDPKPNDAK